MKMDAVAAKAAMINAPPGRCLSPATPLVLVAVLEDTPPVLVAAPGVAGYVPTQSVPQFPREFPWLGQRYRLGSTHWDRYPSSASFCRTPSSAPFFNQASHRVTVVDCPPKSTLTVEMYVVVNSASPPDPVSVAWLKRPGKYIVSPKQQKPREPKLDVVYVNAVCVHVEGLEIVTGTHTLVTILFSGVEAVVDSLQVKE